MNRTGVKPIEKSRPPLLFGDLALARRVEAAWDHLGVENALSQQRHSPDAGAEVLSVGRGHAVFLGPGSPLSQAQGLGLHGPVRQDDVAAIERFFSDRETPTQIEVASLADPSLLAMLSVRGYGIVEQTHSLVAPQSDWPEPGEDDAGAVDDVEIERVPRDALDLWIDVVLGCFFEAPLVPPPALREGALAMGLAPGVTAWIARIEGQLAGGGSLAVHAGVGLICGDGTLPSFRHRGVQTALLRARLQHARREGCDLAAICTQPGSGSQRNAERQGFRIVYARTMLIRH